MTLPDCRPGTYPTDGVLVKTLREKTRFGDDTEAFRDSPPAISKPTLERAEASGCCFQATLAKLAVKLGVDHWSRLVDKRTQFQREPIIKKPKLAALTTDHDFAAFDETDDGMRVMDTIQTLIRRSIPFIVVAFRPRNSVQTVVLLQEKDFISIEKRLARNLHWQLNRQVDLDDGHKVIGFSDTYIHTPTLAESLTDAFLRRIMHTENAGYLEEIDRWKRLYAEAMAENDALKDALRERS